MPPRPLADEPVDRESAPLKPVALPDCTSNEPLEPAPELALAIRTSPLLVAALPPLKSATEPPESELEPAITVTEPPAPLAPAPTLN